jgi:hypothetical protein
VRGNDESEEKRAEANLPFSSSAGERKLMNHSFEKAALWVHDTEVAELEVLLDKILFSAYSASPR